MKKETPESENDLGSSQILQQGHRFCPGVTWNFHWHYNKCKKAIGKSYYQIILGLYGLSLKCLTMPKWFPNVVAASAISYRKESAAVIPLTNNIVLDTFVPTTHISKDSLGIDNPILSASPGQHNPYTTTGCVADNEMHSDSYDIIENFAVQSKPALYEGR